MIHSMSGLCKQNITYNTLFYPCIFMNKTLLIFRNFECDVNRYDKSVSGLSAVNEVHKLVVLILDDIIIFCCQWFYDIMRVIWSFHILHSRF